MSLGPDLLLGVESHDLEMVGGDAQMVASLAQAIKIRLLFFKAEWFLDQEVGIPYFQDIFVKNPNLDQIEALFRQEIADTPGVVAVHDVDVELDRENRRLTITWSAEGDSGLIDGVEVI